MLNQIKQPATLYEGNTALNNLGFFHSTKLQSNMDGLVTNRSIHENDFLLLWEIFEEKLPSDQTWLIANKDGNRPYVPCFSLEELRKERVFEDFEVFRLVHRILTGLNVLHGFGHYHGALHLRNIFWNPQNDHLYIVDPILEAQIQQNIQNPYAWIGDLKMLGSAMASLKMTLQPVSLHDLDHLHLPLSFFLSKMMMGDEHMKKAGQTLDVLNHMLRNFRRFIPQKIANSSSLQILESFRASKIFTKYKPYIKFATEEISGNQYVSSGQFDGEEQSETKDSSATALWGNDTKDALLLSPDCFSHLLRGIEGHIQWSRKQKKHASSEIVRRNQYLAEDIFVKQRGKEKSSSQEALSLWTNLLKKWTTESSEDSPRDILEENESNTSTEIASELDLKNSTKIIDIRSDLLSFAWLMLSIGESGHWRAPFTIEGQLCDMLLRGEKIPNHKKLSRSFKISTKIY